jgi:hypothetical protein
MHLSESDINQFIHKGFVKIENAFSGDLAEQVRARLWRDMKISPSDRSTWKWPVIRLGMYSEPPFVQAANSPKLHQAFDDLVGVDQWIPCQSMGTFPVRFPSPEPPGDTGWHVDAGFAGNNPSNYFDWRINMYSKGRALLMLFLFSDVQESDAPTRIRTGSHLSVASQLSKHGAEGLSFLDVATGLNEPASADEVLTIGEAGTVYLCHPFIVHAAQQHRGTEPRFLAQPPLLPRHELVITDKTTPYSPVEAAIRLGAMGLKPTGLKQS